jgi:N-acetylmuramoyl-L-alanine amidase
MLKGINHMAFGVARIHGFVFSFLVLLLVKVFPAEAGQLLSWRFDRSQNRLEFTTNDGIRPKAQLLPDPTRVVIDLPNTTLGQSPVNQSIGGQISNLRIGQFDPNTTRIVIELLPGYTLNPQGIQIKGIATNQWAVTLPQPQVEANSRSTLAQTPTASSAATRITGWRGTPDGLFIRTSGANPKADLYRTQDPRTIELDIPNADLDPSLINQVFAVPDLGVEQLTFLQVQANPYLTRVRLRLAPNALSWRASVSNLGGIVLLPQRQPVALQTRPNARTPPVAQAPTPAPTPTPTPAPIVPAQVQAVSLDATGNQLLIQTDRPVDAQGAWLGQQYRVTLSPAQLAPNIQGPQLGASSPLSRIRLRQESAQTVVILLDPAAGVSIEAPQAINQQVISLQLRGTHPVPIPPPITGPISPPVTGPIQPNPPVQGRLLVVIDPGHGGPDPGAIGIGNIYEKNLVLPIAQDVAAILAQQGIQTVLTRPDDRDLDLEPRTALANQLNATVFVSIHANAISLSRPEVNGIETYYYGSTAGLQLAQFIHQSLLHNLPVRDRGVREARFYVLRNTEMPAALAEVGFVTGAEDAPRLADPNYRRQIAAAIAQGILQYLQ